MIMFDGGVGLLLLGLWVFCLIDVITTDPALCRWCLPRTTSASEKVTPA